MQAARTNIAGVGHNGGHDMNTEQMMDQAEKVMAGYVCDGLEGDARLEMDRLVHRFFSDRVSGLEPSEIMEHMATPMKAVDWFNNFFCEALRSCCCADPNPEDADACSLA
jgi:hypothetical protein